MKLLPQIVLLFSIQIFSQVGIGTVDPTASLDINGNLRIRAIQEEIDQSIATDSVLVISRDGTVNRISSKKIFESNIKTAIRGNFTGSGNISILLGSNIATIPFNSEDFDVNNEFDVATHTFTAKQDGIYQIYVQINSSGAIAASTDYGVQILKENTIIAQQNYANLSLLGLSLTPPIRSVQTLIQLNKGEKIRFQLLTNLLSVNLLRSKTDSFFTIQQIR